MNSSSSPTQTQHLVFIHSHYLYTTRHHVLFTATFKTQGRYMSYLISNPTPYLYRTGLRSTNPEPKPHAPTTDPHSISISININILTTENPRTQKSNGSNATKPDAYQSINATSDLQPRHRPPSLLLRGVAKSSVSLARHRWLQSRRERLRLR